MTFHSDEPADTPSWVSNTQDWLTDLDRDPDYISYEDDPEPDFDEADYPPDPDEGPDDALGSPAENNPADDGEGGDAESGDADPVSAVVPGDDPSADVHAVGANGIDEEAPVLGGGEAARDDKEPPRYNKAIVGGFIAVVVVVALGITSAMLGMRRTPEVAQAPSESSIKVTAAPQAAPLPPPDAPGTAGIPFTASAPGCLPGSTAAQSVATGDPTQAWVCVRGGVDGQVLTIDLGRTMAVTAIRITPGWVGTDSSGADQWLQHRVLTRVQWILTDHGNQPTIVKQNTGNVHGEAPQPMSGQGVLASTITMIVQETSRPPADAPPTDSANPSPGGQGGLLDQVIGAPLNAPPSPSHPDSPIPGMPQDQSQTDPVDNTFAVSSIVVEGHTPLPS